MSRVLDARFARFILVGTLNTAFSFGLYVVFLMVGLPYAIANLLALIAGILVSFRTQGQFVFGNRDTRLLGRFALCWGLVWLVNILLIAVFLRLGLDAYWAGAFALAPTTVLSYFMQKVLVFASVTQPRENV